MEPNTLMGKNAVRAGWVLGVEGGHAFQFCFHKC